jgi:hypothetical protein
VVRQELPVGPLLQAGREDDQRLAVQRVVLAAVERYPSRSQGSDRYDGHTIRAPTGIPRAYDDDEACRRAGAPDIDAVRELQETRSCIVDAMAHRA